MPKARFAVTPFEAGGLYTPPAGPGQRPGGGSNGRKPQLLKMYRIFPEHFQFFLSPGLLQTWKLISSFSRFFKVHENPDCCKRVLVKLRRIMFVSSRTLSRDG